MRPVESENPRPPRVEHVDDRVTVTFGGQVVVDTTDVVRRAGDVASTGLRPADWRLRARRPHPRRRRLALRIQGRRELPLRLGRRPYGRGRGLDVPLTLCGKGDQILRGRVALYPGRMDACTVAGEPVTPQEGDFYGGWITSWDLGSFQGCARHARPGKRPRLGPSRSPYAGRMPPAPLPSVTVIVPWRPAPSRVPAFDFVLDWYARRLPEFVGEDRRHRR